MNKFWLLVIVFFAACSARAQDMILKKDGSAIPCKIVLVDSTLIVYQEHGKPAHKFIRRTEVDHYIIAPAGMKKTRDTAAFEIERDLLFLTFMTGRGFPQADFGSQSMDNEHAGLAYPGGLIFLSLSVKVHPMIGVGIAYRRQTFQFNESLITREFERTNPTLSFRSEAEPWIMSGVFGRLYLLIPVIASNKISLELEGQLGAPRYYYPELTVEASQGNASVTLTNSAERETAFTPAGCIRLSYRPAPMFAMHAQADYFGARATFNTVTRIAGSTVDESPYTQTFRALTVGVGISLIIQKD